MCLLADAIAPADEPPSSIGTGLSFDGGNELSMGMGGLAGDEGMFSAGDSAADVAGGKGNGEVGSWEGTCGASGGDSSSPRDDDGLGGGKFSLGCSVGEASG